MAIRLFFFLLVFANLLFFAWTQGYFGTPDEGREPQRLSQQLHAEKLRIVREAEAPAIKKDDIACREISGLKMADAETLKAAAEAGGGEAKVLPLAEPTLYLVVITDLANKAAAERKSAELARFGIEGHSIVALEDGRHEIVLGRFESEAAAREFLQGIARRGIKSARLDSRQQPAVRARVEMRGPASTLLLQLPKLIGPFADASVGECPL